MLPILKAFNIFLATSTYLGGNVDDVPDPSNNKPIIGILTQELDPDWKIPDPTYTSYVSASYIKYIEMAGARVVPIRINRTEEYYERIFKSINGILFPGGSSFTGSSGFGKAGRILWRLALESNDRGDYFPVWGTCLGFEMMMYLAANETDLRTKCSSNDEVLPLQMTDEVWQSRLLGDIDYWMTVFLSKENVSINFHQWCITKENFKKAGLDKFFLLLSTNKDLKGQEFISTVEAFNYPFYATQWHPEKNGFEWTTREPNIPHSLDAIEVMQYFANFLVQEARRNNHHFGSEEEETKELIYNYNPIFSYPLGINFDQLYVFRDGKD